MGAKRERALACVKHRHGAAARPHVADQRREQEAPAGVINADFLSANATQTGRCSRTQILPSLSSLCCARVPRPPLLLPLLLPAQGHLLRPGSRLETCLCPTPCKTSQNTGSQAGAAHISLRSTLRTSGARPGLNTAATATQTARAQLTGRSEEEEGPRERFSISLFICLLQPEEGGGTDRRRRG